MECIEKVVGLSEQNCSCVGTPPDTSSLSGYYLDDMEYGVNMIIPKTATDDCQGSIWELMGRARKEGARDFTELLGVALANFQEPRFAPFKGLIGDEKSNSFLQVNSGMPVIGAEIKPIRQYRGSVMHVTKIRLFAMSDLQSVNVTINEWSQGVLSPAFTLQKISEFEYAVDTDLVLPLHDEYGYPTTYTYSYNAENIKPRNLKWNCGCGGSGQRPWMNFVEANGFAAQAYGAEKIYTNKRFTCGLQFDASIRCKELDFLCQQDDWMSAGWNKTAARVMQLLSINKLIGAVLNSTRINRFTMLSKESLYGKRNHNRKEAEERIAWLAANIPASANDCFCRTTIAQKGTILV